MIIHQIWWNNDFDDYYNIYKQIIQKNNWFLKNHEYHLWLPNQIREFLQKTNNWDNVMELGKKTYKYKKFKAESNLIRLLILYEYGGMYLDLNVVLLRQFEEFYNNLDRKIDTIFKPLDMCCMYFNSYSTNLLQLIEHVKNIKFWSSDKETLVTFNFNNTTIRVLPNSVIYNFLTYQNKFF